MNKAKMLRRLSSSFSYSSNAMVPEIPYTQDVLYILRLSENQKCYDVCAGNHQTYVDNVQLVVEKIGEQVVSMRPYDEAKARRIIAEAIIDLCPGTARCFFNPAFVDAKETFIPGLSLPLKGVDNEKIRRACPCSSCVASLEKETPFTD